MLTVFQKIVIGLSILVILASAYFTFTIILKEEDLSPPKIPFVDGDFMIGDMEEITVPIEVEEPKPETEVSTTTEVGKEGDTEEQTEAVKNTEVLVENLTIPWGIGFLPNEHLLISQRNGVIVDVDLVYGKTLLIELEGVSHSGEGGLLGLALHPDFEKNNYVYLYKTSRIDGKSVNSVFRYTYERGKLMHETLILGDIPGAFFHDGGRIAFGPDGHLYITTGDAQNPEYSPNINSLAGKILRVTDTGEIPQTNPFGNEVYSYGHRNAQGIAWDSDGALWSTEHGRSGLQSGLDELNLIIPGGNYGWPKSQGNTVFTDTIGPTIHSGNITWAPAGAAYYKGSIFFGGLKGETLYQAVLSGVSVVELKEHFKGVYGRIRTVALGPDNMLYIMTSNRDGRGDIRGGDDKVVRINPEQFFIEEEVESGG
jgi:glucose/arabinose dehydrogenase